MIRPINWWFALLELRSNKLRSALTILGVVIGVGAVIMIVSLGNGLRRSTEIQMEAFSRGTIEVRPRPLGMYGMSERLIMMEKTQAVRVGEGPGMPMPQPMQMQELASADAQAIRRISRSSTAVVAIFSTYGQLVAEGQQVPYGEIMGVDSSYMEVFRERLKAGRFLTPMDEENAAQVMVISEWLAEQVWGEGVDPVGKIMHVSYNEVPQNYVIVGVIAQQDGMEGYAPRSILVPLRTAQLRLNDGPRNRVNMIAARVDSRETSERRFAVAEINTILRARRNIQPGAPEDFWVQDTLQWKEESERIIRTMTLVLSLIAGMSLVVGSIGLMNIMLVGVTERTWEIGLRRALGAEKGDIMLQFMGEGTLLALTGGVLGLGLGLAGSYAGSMAVEQLKGLASATPDVFIIALVVSLVVGAASSIHPAWRAANLQPTTALRRG